MEQDLDALVESLGVLTQLVASITDAEGGHDAQPGEDGADGGFAKDVGAGQEDNGAAQLLEQHERIHEGVLVARGQDIGAVRGQMLTSVGHDMPIVAAGGEVDDKSQQDTVSEVIGVDGSHRDCLYDL